LLVAFLALAVISTSCGGGGNSSSSSKVQVSISPQAVAVTLNGTQLFQAGVIGSATIKIAATNGAVRASNVVTITTTTAHGFAAGQTVTVTGVTDTSFDGNFVVVSAPSTTTFTYAQTAADASSGNGTVGSISVNWFVNDVQGGNTTLGTITSAGLYTAPSAFPPPVTASITPTGAVRASNVVTITTSAAHDLIAGQTVIITGVTDTSFNGTFVIASVPSTTTFTFNQTANNASSGNGTVTSFAVKIKAVSLADSSATATAIVDISSGVTVRVVPANARLGTNETFQFTASVTGSTNSAVTWSVNDLVGGNSTVGTITSNGLFTAPATPPNLSTLSINATGAVRASNVVTITTSSAHGFLVGQAVTIAGVSDSSFNGTFSIATVPSTSTFTYSQTGPDVTSGGGTATSGSSSVTIKATSVVDPTRMATALAGVQTAGDPTLTSISPTTAPQGAVFQDVFLTGTNFLSTTTVRINSVPLPSAAISEFSVSLIRIRIPASLLASPGTLTIDAQRQSGATSASLSLAVVPVRPALVGASRQSAVQGGGTFSFDVNGGYFGAASSPAITAEFSGNTRAAAVSATNEGRQATVTLGSSDLTNAGLFSVAIRNSSNTALAAATNLAVRPSGTPSILGSPIAVGSLPGSIAINAATGVAVVSNRCSNTVTRIDVATLASIGSGIPVGAFPTGVAVDDFRNLAVVANNGNNSGCTGSAGTSSLSIVDLAAGSVTSTVTANLSAFPFSVGVNPITGLALVTYQSANHADILDLTQTPPAIVSTTTISTGANPQVTVEPRLNWAVVTPGGAGTLSIVDLSLRQTATIASSNGASRASGVTTITTAASHSFRLNQVVFISGVLDASFNGVFTISSVPSSTTFTYAQTGGANATSGGGIVVTTPPVATATIGSNARGVAINAFTQQAILADPSTAGPSLFNLFDQAVTSINLGEIGAVAAAFNPFTNIAVTTNANTNEASVIDPEIPARLAKLSVGVGPRAVAIDPGTNTALVVNETDGTVTAIGLGAIRSPHITAISMPLNRQLAPGITLSSTLDLPLTVLGKGFVPGTLVRLDGVALAAPSSVTDRLLSVIVPATLLSGPRRFVVDVQDPSGELSNVLELAVVQPVDLVGAGGSSCAAPAPAAVAIDAQRDSAVVTNFGCDSASIVDLTNGSITATVAVQSKPAGVAVNSRLGRAVVTNSGAGTASLLDLTVSPPAVTSNVTVGSEPLGVTIDEGTGQAIVANASSSSLSIFDATSGGGVSSVPVDTRPVAVAVDPDREVAAVAHAASNNVAVVSLSSLSISGRVSNVSFPTAVAFDPVTGLFIANSSLGNNLYLVNPDTLQAFLMGAGINPTSLAYNVNSSTLVIVNSASNSISVMDFLARRIRTVFGISASSQFAVGIHPRTNLAVVADQPKNRVLLVPLPH
jgi:DNA-binding beta-propeller fold protein YncE